MLKNKNILEGFRLKKSNDTDMKQKIIDHLQSIHNQQDDLKGLTLALYNKEMKNLSDVIVNTISRLITTGVLKEIKTKNGNRYYKLLDSNKNS